MLENVRRRPSEEDIHTTHIYRDNHLPALPDCAPPLPLLLGAAVLVRVSIYRRGGPLPEVHPQVVLAGLQGRPEPEFRHQCRVLGGAYARHADSSTGAGQTKKNFLFT